MLESSALGIAKRHYSPSNVTHIQPHGGLKLVVGDAVLILAHLRNALSCLSCLSNTFLVGSETVSKQSIIEIELCNKHVYV